MTRWARYILVGCRLTKFLLYAFLFLFPFPTPSSARDLTLVQCIDLAVAHDPETQNAKQKAEIGKLKHAKAVRDFLPKVDLYVTQGPQTDYFGRPVTQNNVFYNGLGLEQPLYRGGVLTNSVKLADSETRRQEFEYRFRKLAVASDAIQAYYQALTAQAVIQQHEALLRQGEEDLCEAKARLESGRGTRAEVLDLTVKLLEVQQKLSKARASYQVELSKLKKLIGQKEEEHLSLVRQYPLKEIKDNLQTLFSEAQGGRPDLQYSKEDVTYNQLRTDIERGKRWPQLSLVARQEWQDTTLLTGRKDWLVMLKASVSVGDTTMSYTEQRTEMYPNPYAFPTYPGVPGQTYAFPVRQWKYSIFDRTSNKVELEEARAAMTLSHDRWQQLQRQVYHDVKDAVAQKEDSEARMLTAQKQIDLANELLQITRTKYGVGYATLAEVFKARATLAEARVNLVTARNDKGIALGKLYQALGRDLLFQESRL
jgi:outer membrane protein TolC